MKRSILTLMLALSLALTGTLVVNATHEVDQTDVWTMAFEDIQILSHPSSCRDCGSSLNFSAVTVGTFTKQSHSYGFLWLNTCNYETAPISRVASCISSTCSYRITLNGTRHRNHSGCSESNGDRW